MSRTTISRGARLAPVALALLVLAAAFATRLAESSVAAVSTTLHGTVGPGSTISLNYTDGSPVMDPPPGTYTVIVEDRSDEHNFHLFGPGVEETTAVGGQGTVTWRVTFRNDAAYDFTCDPHSDSMYGRFKVGNPRADTPASVGGSGGGSGPVVSSGTGVIRGTLDATISAVPRLTVRLKGKPVTKLRQGRYRIVISDRSTKNNVAIRQIGGRESALTGVSFTGKRTLTLALTPGRWKLYSGVREADTSAFLTVTKT